MTRFLYLFFTNIISWILIVFIYLISNNIYIYSEYMSFVLYVFLFFAFSLTNIHSFRYLSRDTISHDCIIKTVNINYIVSIIYVIVSLLLLNIQNIYIFLLFIFLISILNTISSTFYFNPILLFFKYNIYLVQFNTGWSGVIITRDLIKNVKYISFDSLTRINEYVFIYINK